jgi:hypothetical protein
VATRAQVERLLAEGESYEAVGKQLGITPGFAYLLATGKPADDGDRPRQDLVNPPVHNPTRNERVMAWVRERAGRELLQAK